MTAHSYPLTELAEYNGGQMGSWLTSFLSCGGLKCPKPLSNDAIIGQVALQVSAVLQQSGKFAEANAIKTETKKALDTLNAYAVMMTDPTAVASIVQQIVNALVSSGKALPIPGTAPTTIAPSPTVIPAIGQVNPLYVYGGIGAVALLLLMRR